MPKDLDLKTGPRRFTITVSYDTLDLYGQVTASREVTVEPGRPKPKDK